MIMSHVLLNAHLSLETLCGDPELIEPLANYIEATHRKRDKSTSKR